METSNVAGKTFVRIIEYRVPSANANPLEFGGGWFGQAQSGPLGHACSTGVPAVEGRMIALPIAPKGRITSVLALHF